MTLPVANLILKMWDLQERKLVVVLASLWSWVLVSEETLCCYKEV